MGTEAVQRVKVSSLPTLAEMQAKRRATPKGVPHQIAKQREKKADVVKDDAFRLAIWNRDKGRSRATGKPLKKSGISWDEIGEVDHAIPRSIAPDRIWDLGNALLLSKTENRLRKVSCIRAPEHKYFDYSGPDNRKKPQTFVWRDDDGKITKTRIG